MRKQILSICAAMIMASGIVFAAEKTKAQSFVENMGIGINLGNTMEAIPGRK